MIEIIPSPGTQNRSWQEIAEKIEAVKEETKTIHIDIIDGKFADNTTFLDPTPFSQYTKELFFEAHFMVEEPLLYIKPWAQVGIKRFIGQIEKMPDQMAFVESAKLYGEVGLALDDISPIEAINIPLQMLDTVLVMTIHAGFSGQEFKPELLRKVTLLKEKTQIPICVDGGISDKTLLLAKDAGVDRCIVTSFIFQGKSPRNQLALLQDLGR